jgi:hypothetical protein
MKFMTGQRSMSSSITSFISLLFFTSAITCIRPVWAQTPAPSAAATAAACPPAAANAVAQLRAAWPQALSAAAAACPTTAVNPEAAPTPMAAAIAVPPYHPDRGVFKTTSTSGAAILASYALTDNFFLAGRLEGISSSGDATDGSANLLYGPGSEAWSITLTPTYQYKNFFARGEASFVQAVQDTAGDVFGNQNRNPAEVRGVLETGLLF